MERFSDYDFVYAGADWVVSALDSENEEVLELEVHYWDLIHFIREYYGMDKKGAIDHLGTCPDDEEENLLKLYFTVKMR